MGVVHALLLRAACAHTIGAVHPPPAILLSCTLPRAPGVRKDGTFESVQHVCERAARTSRVLDMAAVSRVGLILSRTYPVRLHRGERCLGTVGIRSQPTGGWPRLTSGFASFLLVRISSAPDAAF